MSDPTPPPARPRRATNLTVRGDLLAAVKRRQWRREHAEAIEAYNEYVGQHAPAFQGARTF